MLRSEFRKFLATVRIDIISRGYRIAKSKSSRRWNSVYLVCYRDSDQRRLYIRVSDHDSRNVEKVDVSVHPGGANREELLRWLK